MSNGIRKRSGPNGGCTWRRTRSLRSFIERIERLEEEKKTIADDIKDVYAEAKANGFDTKILRKIVSLRKQDRDERMEEEAILELYKQALGMG